MGFGERLMHAWNAFTGNDKLQYRDLGYSSYLRPDRSVLTRGNERSIISAIYERIALDVAQISFEHSRIDDEGRYLSTIDSKFNECLTMSANIDQTGRAFIQDAVITMLDSGCIAIVPVETTIDPNRTNAYDITQLRVGKVTDWYPKHVKVNLYNEKTGKKEEIILPKSYVAIVENPFYSVMNEPNSTMQRLMHKLAMLDAVDEQASSGKLDLIIQLPYVIKSEARKREADKRRQEIADQLTGSQYGIAYTDGTERITQLNRPIENNLLKQIEYLTELLYSQLGMPKEVFDGTADEKVMLNYYNRTVEPIASAIVDEMKRKFLTKTARTQGQSITVFRDPFKLVPVSQIAEIADKLTRNEILTSNEVRQIIGYKPSDDPKADELRNKNINEASDANSPEGIGNEDLGLEGEIQNEGE